MTGTTQLIYPSRRAQRQAAIRRRRRRILQFYGLPALLGTAIVGTGVTALDRTARQATVTVVPASVPSAVTPRPLPNLEARAAASNRVARQAIRTTPAAIPTPVVTKKATPKVTKKPTKKVTPKRTLPATPTYRVIRSREAAKTYARGRLARYGWGPSQWSCLDRLWQRESGWRWNADNPTSSAYGIPQALPGRKMSTHGKDWATNGATQIRWGLDYIKGRYGTPCGAWAHSERVGWY